MRTWAAVISADIPPIEAQKITMTPGRSGTNARIRAATSSGVP